MSKNDNSRDLPDLPPRLLNEDEALAIENAIRAAVNTVMNVVRGARERRVLEYQRMVADRDEEIRRLEGKLEKSERELTMLRPEAGRRRQSDHVKSEPEDKPCGVGAAALAHLSPKCRDTAEAFPHQRAQTETPPWEAEGAATSHQPLGCVAPLVKEEPSDSESVIKWEVCEGSLLDRREARRGAEERPARRDTQAECEAKAANPQMNKLMTTEEEDKNAGHLKRKGGERNGCRLSESEEEEVVMKKSCVTQPSAPKITAQKDSLPDISSPQPHRQSSDGSVTSKLNAQDSLACQRQTYIAMTAPQPTCDPILLEVLVSLETIKQQNTTVLQILQSGNSSGTLLCEPPEVGTLPLPLQSVQDLRSLEQRLSTEPELKKKMISYLGLAGGMTTKESVWRIMAKLFTNTLAKNINWRGRNNKQKIENLTIQRVILSGTLTTDKETRLL
ncbi:uncharacterized protein LOC120783614 isoform X2 [Xiphias gladius]|uniref:uncharacterized protein LOC120783614 isoform X2 n=1 Tax=Xiphias gladius TaxID=8245 RepID=UPI001A98A979|nr:uncharacterized protein LOC120783614 isoform X2 [Xiphias gladius]